MKKFLILFLLFLAGCDSSVREDYYELSIDDYSISVGYDNAEYLDIAYDFDLPQEFEENQKIKDVEIKLLNHYVGIGDFINTNDKKSIESSKAILSKLTIYLNDWGYRTFKINGEVLDESIKKNCDKFGGTYIERNGYACVIENKVEDELNVIEMYGDYLNIDQDKLDHVVIYVE